MSTKEKTNDCQYNMVDNMPEKYGFGVRHFQSFLVFICLAVGYIMRVNMSVAIIAMTDNSTTLDVEIFPWDKSIQDDILSSFFLGYTIMQIPGGQLAHRYGAKFLLTVAMLVNGIITLATPWMVTLGGWKLLYALRVLQGLAQSSLFPCIHTFTSKWIPNSERSRLGNFMFTGTSIGTIVALPLSSLLASTSIGWPCIFYVIGTLGILTGILWGWLGANTPATHRSISLEEKYYIETSLASTEAKKALKTPWKSIFTSMPLLAIAVTHIGINWGFLTLLTETPSYLKHALGIDMKSSGLLSALPYTAMWLGSIIMSFVSDYLVNSKILSTTICRKLFNTIGSWVPAISLVALGYIPPGHEYYAVGLLIITVGSCSGMNMGYMMNHIDLSPNFAGTLMGITNCVANAVAFLAPITVGQILGDNANDPARWRIAFLLTASIYFFTNLFFIIFGTSKKQPWNEPNIFGDVEMKVGKSGKTALEEKESMILNNK